MCIWKILIVWLQLHFIDALVAFDYVTTAREQRHPTQGWLPEKISLLNTGIHMDA